MQSRREPFASVGLTSKGVSTPAEREEIVRGLEQADWVLAGPRGAAASLGMKRTTLQSLMKRLGIEKPA